MPWPTRAMIVSSVAPPMSCVRFVRTVTRALTSSSMPFLATALSVALPDARIGAVDDFGHDARPHGVEHVAAGQVDRGGPVEIERNAGPVGGDDRQDHVRHVAAGQIVRLEPLRADAVAAADVEARLRGHDLRLHDHREFTCRKPMPIRPSMLTSALDMYAWNQSLP